MIKRLMAKWRARRAPEPMFEPTPSDPPIDLDDEYKLFWVGSPVGTPPLRAIGVQEREGKVEGMFIEDKAWASGGSYVTTPVDQKSDGILAARYFHGIFGNKVQRDLAVRLMNKRVLTEQLLEKHYANV